MTQDFTTYDATHKGTSLTVTSASKITATNLSGNEVGYIFKDLGAGHFTGNFCHSFDFKITANTGSFLWNWMVADATGEYVPLYTANANFLSVYVDLSNNLTLVECVDGVRNNPTPYVISLNTSYYCTVWRDTAVGTYGTAYLNVYSDSGRTTLLSSMTYTLTATRNYQYIYGANGYRGGIGNAISGYNENLDLSAVVPGTNNSNMFQFF